jgi:hypothetical protein
LAAWRLEQEIAGVELLGGIDHDDQVAAESDLRMTGGTDDRVAQKLVAPLPRTCQKWSARLSKS